MRDIKFRVFDGTGMYFGGFSIHATGKFINESWYKENKEYPVMQYTGLKDANGVEIYEGDIVDFYGVNCAVIWEDSDASFFVESPDKSLLESGQEFGNNCEVIGNIYQNPELLNG